MSSPATPASPSSQATLDRVLVRVYLNDHLAGSIGGLRRLRRTAETLGRTPVGPGIARVAAEVDAEHEELKEIIDGLGMPQSLPKQAATWAAERVARLKSNGRVFRHSSMTPLLEIELLRSAVMGKRGLWQTLVDIGPALDVDPARAQELVDQTDRQLRTLDEAHAYVRTRALTERSRL
jgi:UDP-glucose 4-epimerase